LVGVDLIQFSTDHVKKFLNWLRTSFAVSITTVCDSKKPDRYEYYILTYMIKVL